ncbi:hypothetical protein Tco_0613503 [Tanacetum coccineum]
MHNRMCMIGHDNTDHYRRLVVELVRTSAPKRQPILLSGTRKEKGSKQATDGNPGILPEDQLHEICEKPYDQILPIIAEKVHQEKLKGVQARLSYSESSRQKAPTK